MSDPNRTERFLKAVTHPTQVIRRAEIRRQEEGPQDWISPRLSLALLGGALVACTVGLAVIALGLVTHVTGVLLLGVLLVTAGMAAVSLEGLLLPDRDELAVWAAIKRVMHR